MIKGWHLGLIVFFMTSGVIATPISDECFDSNNLVEHEKSIEPIIFFASGHLLLYKVVNKQPAFFKVYDSTPFFPKTSHFPKTPESLVILCKVLIKKMLEHKEFKKSIVGA